MEIYLALFAIGLALLICLGLLIRIFTLPYTPPTGPKWEDIQVTKLKFGYRLDYTNAVFTLTKEEQEELLKGRWVGVIFMSLIFCPVIIAALLMRAYLIGIVLFVLFVVFLLLGLKHSGRVTSMLQEGKIEQQFLPQWFLRRKTNEKINAAMAADQKFSS